MHFDAKCLQNLINILRRSWGVELDVADSAFFDPRRSQAWLLEELRFMCLFVPDCGRTSCQSRLTIVRSQRDLGTRGPPTIVVTGCVSATSAGI